MGTQSKHSTVSELSSGSVRQLKTKLCVAVESLEAEQIADLNGGSRRSFHFVSRRDQTNEAPLFLRRELFLATSTGLCRPRSLGLARRKSAKGSAHRLGKTPGDGARGCGCFSDNKNNNNNKPATLLSASMTTAATSTPELGPRTGRRLVGWPSLVASSQLLARRQARPCRVALSASLGPLASHHTAPKAGARI